MSNETPGQDPVPGWGPKPPEDATAPWPADAVPPEAPWPTEAAPEPVPPEPAPAPAAPAAPWGAPAATPPTPDPAAPWAAPQQAPVPGAVPSWGAPPPQQQPAQPAAPSWGASPPQQQPPTPGTGPSWGAPPAWGAPPPQQPGGGWGAPPPQQPGGWSPGGPGAPGGPPVGWAPAPARSGNGCLKGCLIAGAIGIVLLIILVIAGGIFFQRFAEDMGINPDGTITECPLISNGDLEAVLGGDAYAMPLTGIVDATVGLGLDKRVIPDAEDCWITASVDGSGSNAALGRIARQAGGDASGTFRTAHEAAETGGYLESEVDGLGDEAFCTRIGEVGSAGVLVRRGDTLVYVSLFSTNDTCALSQEVARKVLR